MLRLREGHMLGCSTLSFESPATNSDAILLQWHHFKFVGLVCTILNPLDASCVAVISLLFQQCSLLSVCSPICNDKYFQFVFCWASDKNIEDTAVIGTICSAIALLMLETSEVRLMLAWHMETELPSCTFQGYSSEAGSRHIA